MSAGDSIAKTFTGDRATRFSVARESRARQMRLWRKARLCYAPREGAISVGAGDLDAADFRDSIGARARRRELDSAWAGRAQGAARQGGRAGGFLGLHLR